MSLVAGIISGMTLDQVKEIHGNPIKLSMIQFKYKYGFVLYGFKITAVHRFSEKKKNAINFQGID